MKQKSTYIYGKHALLEALENSPQIINKIFLSPQKQEDEKIIKAIEKAGKNYSNLGKEKTDVKDTDAHQGVIAKINIDNLVLSYKDFINNLAINDDTCLAVLGELEDPHNIGAIIRSAAGFGLSGVILPEHRGAPVTGTVVKVSAGMAFRIPIVRTGNINDTLKNLKDKGFWIYGLDAKGDKSLPEEKFDNPTCFVIGNEARGLKKETRKNCDLILSIPTHSRTESLNAAASSAVTFYDWSTKHPHSLD